LGVAFALVVLVAVGCMGGYGYVQDRRNAFQHELTELGILSQGLATRIDHSLATGKGLVGNLACTEDVERFLGAKPDQASRATFQRWLALQVGQTPNLATIFLLSPTGDCLASTNPAFLGRNFGFRPYFQEAMAGRFSASDWMIGTVTRLPRICAAAPVRLGGRIQGVLVTQFLVDEVVQAIRSTGVKGRAAAVINASGVTLAHSDSGFQYHSIVPLDSATQATLIRTRQFQGQPIPSDPLSGEFVAAFDRVRDTASPETLSYRLGGAVKWATLSPATERPWVVMVAIPEAEILLPIRRAMVRTLLVGLIATLGGFLVAFVLGKPLLAPIHLLAEAMGRFGAGDVTARAPVRTRDERGQLARTFNGMAESLQAHRERLEELVKARTLELSRSESALRESNQRMELATASNNLGIWDRDLQAGTEFWSDRVFEIYGLPPEHRSVDYAAWSRYLLHPDDLAATDAAIQAAVAGEQPYDISYRIVRQDGSIRHVKSDAHVVRDADGKAVRIIGINRDRTREVEAEAEQRRLQAELQHSEILDSLGSLAGGVAHDMNNVLAAIMGMASALRAGGPDEGPGAKSLDTIIRACTRGRDVVKSLLHFARKDLDTVGPVNLNAIAAEMVQLLSHTTLRRVRIVTAFTEPLSRIEGDGNALNHALINVCVNAVDAMPDGGTLEIRTRQSAERGVEISIRDSGEGMNAEVIRKAVEPFFTTKPVGKGTGLGLAMVYGTVKAHKGTFEIHSEPGRGTEVILGFPALPETPAAPAVKTDAPGVSASGPRRILLVDDDELIRMSVGPMLTALGHEVHTAESGQEALERVQDLDPDLVILDMNMPGLNGTQTLARLLTVRPHQRVVMATGYSDDSIVPLMAGRPNVFSLRKPFSLEEMRAKLASL
jgi:PAS domain S-box-containing protein